MESEASAAVADLDVPTRPADTRGRSSVFTLGNLLPILTGLGVIIYGVLRIAYFQFYDNFGLTPEDVGLGYSEVLAQSVSGLVVLLVVAFFYVLVFIGLSLIWVSLGKAFGRMLRDRNGRIALIVVLLIGGMFWAMERYAASINTVVRLLIIWFIIAILLWASVRLGWWAESGSAMEQASEQTTHRPESEVSESSTPEEVEKDLDSGSSPRFWNRAIIAAVILAPTTVLALLLLSANSDARAVARGRVVREVFGFVPVASWGAETATLTPVGDDATKALALVPKGCVMYLGHAHGHILVVVPGTLTNTLKIPENEVVVTITPDRTNCFNAAGDTSAARLP